MTLEIYAQTRAMSLFIFFSFSLSLFLVSVFFSEIYTTALQTPNQHKNYRNTSGKITQNEGNQSIVKKYLCDLAAHKALSVCLFDLTLFSHAFIFHFQFFIFMEFWPVPVNW